MARNSPHTSHPQAPAGTRKFTCPKSVVREPSAISIIFQYGSVGPTLCSVLRWKTTCTHEAVWCRWISMVTGEGDPFWMLMLGTCIYDIHCVKEGQSNVEGVAASTSAELARVGKAFACKIGVKDPLLALDDRWLYRCVQVRCSSVFLLTVCSF